MTHKGPTCNYKILKPTEQWKIYQQWDKPLSTQCMSIVLMWQYMFKYKMKQIRNLHHIHIESSSNSRTFQIWGYIIMYPCTIQNRIFDRTITNMSCYCTFHALVYWYISLFHTIKTHDCRPLNRWFAEDLRLNIFVITGFPIWPNQCVNLVA